MGSGIVAFGSRDEASRVLAEHDGRLLDYPALLDARRVWMEERYGKPRPSGGAHGAP